MKKITFNTNEFLEEYKQSHLALYSCLITYGDRFIMFYKDNKYKYYIPGFFANLEECKTFISNNLKKITDYSVFEFVDGMKMGYFPYSPFSPNQIMEAINLNMLEQLKYNAYFKIENDELIIDFKERTLNITDFSKEKMPNDKTIEKNKNIYKANYLLWFNKGHFENYYKHLKEGFNNYFEVKDFIDYYKQNWYIFEYSLFKKIKI